MSDVEILSKRTFDGAEKEVLDSMGTEDIDNGRQKWKNLKLVEK